MLSKFFDMFEMAWDHFLRHFVVGMAITVPLMFFYRHHGIAIAILFIIAFAWEVAQLKHRYSAAPGLKPTLSEYVEYFKDAATTILGGVVVRLMIMAMVG